MDLINNILSLEIWNKVIFANTLGDYAVAFLVFVGLFILIKIIESVVLARLRKLAERTSNDIDDAFVRTIETIRHGFYLFIAFYIAIQGLALHAILNKALSVILILWVVHEVIEALDEIMAYFINRKIKIEHDQSAASAISLSRRITKGVLWVIGILLILSNLGINITSLIAGLGIGGVAIALAAKEVLGDLFSSFSIYFDKPFTIGDLIIVDDVAGHVERIGVKTTRIRSLKGEEVIISNQKLTNAKIENYKKMDERRIVFEIGVDYQTSQETLKKIPEMIKKAIEDTDQARFGRSHFSEFGDSALRIETVYYVESQDFDVYKQAHEQILLKMRESFNEKDILMPFPTRTVFVQGNIK